MKKRILATVLIGAMLASFTACGASSSDDDTSSASTTSSEVSSVDNEAADAEDVEVADETDVTETNANSETSSVVATVTLDDITKANRVTTLMEQHDSVEIDTTLYADGDVDNGFLGYGYVYVENTDDGLHLMSSSACQSTELVEEIVNDGGTWTYNFQYAPDPITSADYKNESDAMDAIDSYATYDPMSNVGVESEVIVDTCMQDDALVVTTQRKCSGEESPMEVYYFLNPNTFELYSINLMRHDTPFGDILYQVQFLYDAQLSHTIEFYVEE